MNQSAACVDVFKNNYKLYYHHNMQGIVLVKRFWVRICNSVLLSSYTAK